MSDPIDRDFVKAHWPEAQAVSRETGVPALLILAVSAYETGWGKDSTILDAGAENNYFGIKYFSDGSVKSTHGLKGPDGKTLYANVPTSEWDDKGVRRPQMDTFTRFASYADSARDWVDWVTGASGLTKYADMKKVCGDDLTRWALELRKRGYSTEPTYEKQIAGVAKRIVAQASDIIGEAPTPATPKPAPASDDKAALAKARQVMELIADDPAVPAEVLKAARAWRDQLKAKVEGGK